MYGVGLRLNIYRYSTVGLNMRSICNPVLYCVVNMQTIHPLGRQEGLSSIPVICPPVPQCPANQIGFLYHLTAHIITGTVHPKIKEERERRPLPPSRFLRGGRISVGNIVWEKKYELG
jgi:hypothetical protein